MFAAEFEFAALLSELLGGAEFAAEFGSVGEVPEPLTGPEGVVIPEPLAAEPFASLPLVIPLPAPGFAIPFGALALELPVVEPLLAEP